MYKYTIKCESEVFGVNSDTDLQSIFAQWNELLHLTGVEVHSDGEHEYIVEYINSINIDVLYSKNRVRISMPLNKLGAGELLFYSALPFLEVMNQRKSMVTMHAAAVELSGNAILLLGKAGAGKTSLTLSLCRNHRARLIGNDIVKVGLIGNKPGTYGGSKYFFLREESIKRNIPDLLSLFPKSGRDSWTHKIYCSPHRLKIDTHNEPTPIARSYLVHIDETMDTLYTNGASKPDTRLYLNENMSRYIRGTAIALFDKDSEFVGYVPSYDTPGFFGMRTGLMELLISDTRLTYLAGKLHDTCNHIISEVQTLRQLD